MPDLSRPARVAALKVLADRVTAEYEEARADAEPHFKALSEEMGVKSMDVRMPSGESAGTVTIRSSRRKIAWNEDALLDLVERVSPQEIDEEIDPAALEDRDLLELLREARPDLVRRTVKPATRKAFAELVSDEGTLIDRTSGEVVTVATVEYTPVTGAFTYAPNTRAQEAVLEAWHRGELAGVGTSLVPALEAGTDRDGPADTTDTFASGPIGDMS
ncbi:hypothetical protein [Nocardiopsis sp. NPDC057823]|uniref:hypothetical protein n=1 Tax=Nocardiopsis sp. NPDC057823 TaxID=3346256 RepID=UPI0036706921